MRRIGRQAQSAFLFYEIIMNQAEKLQRDIKTLRESIEIDRWEMTILNMTLKERTDLMQHLCWCKDEMTQLQDRLAEAKNQKGQGPDKN